MQPRVVGFIRLFCPTARHLYPKQTLKYFKKKPGDANKFKGEGSVSLSEVPVCLNAEVVEIVCSNNRLGVDS